MARQNVYHHALNVGEVDKLALGRIDLTKMRLAAEIYENWFATTLGPMKFRPGTRHCGSIVAPATSVPAGFTADDTVRVRLIPFDFSATDTAIIVATSSDVRVWVDRQPITRVAVGASVTNPNFAAGLAGWTAVLGPEAFATGNPFGLDFAAVALGSSATVHQTVATSSPGIEHAIRIVVTRGPVTFRIGTALGLDDVLTETNLGPGTHSLAFTPAGSFVVQFQTQSVAPKVVASCQIEAAGQMTLPSPWDQAGLKRLQTATSGDVVFCADGRVQQRRIERRGRRSWSITLYEGADGPVTVSPPKRSFLTPSGVNGVLTITATEPVFKPGHVGSLLRLFHTGTQVSQYLAAGGEVTPAWRVVGIGPFRSFSYSVSGTFVGTWSLQRSYDGPDAGFSDVITGTAPAAASLADGLDNQIIWYRLGFRPGLLTSGSALFLVSQSGGSGAGIARIITYASPTEVGVEVLTRFNNNTPTQDWQFGDWSNVRGWPASAAFFDGRLFWGDRFYLYGSESDAFDKFSQDKEGDATSIIRSVGYGSANDARWILPLQRLIAGTSGAEVSIRSSSFDAPLTRSDFTYKNASTFGAAALPPLVADKAGVFVAKDQRSIIELAYNVDQQDYAPSDLTRLNPSICGAGVRATAIQRHPDTRLWFALNNGEVRVLLYERPEDAIAWQRFTTQGNVLSVAVVSAVRQDEVFLAVERAGTIRMEVLNFDDSASGGIGSCNVDASVSYVGAATSTVTGLSHLEGLDVFVYGQNKAYGPLRVVSGQVALPEAVTDYVAGLPYEGRFLSAKLAYVSQQTPMGQRKRIDHVGLVIADTHHDALDVGQDLDRLLPLPRIEAEEEVPNNRVWSQRDIESIPVDGRWTEDARVAIRARSPYPATVMGVTFSLSGHDKV